MTAHDSDTNFIAAIRKAKEILNLDQFGIAKFLGISPHYLSSILTRKATLSKKNKARWSELLTKTLYCEHSPLKIVPGEGHKHGHPLWSCKCGKRKVVSM